MQVAVRVAVAREPFGLDGHPLDTVTKDKVIACAAGDRVAPFGAAAGRAKVAADDYAGPTAGNRFVFAASFERGGMAVSVQVFNSSLPRCAWRSRARRRRRNLQ